MKQIFGVCGRFKKAALDDRRGVFASFFAIITTSLLVLGSVAYDAPRLLAARQDAVHSAFEAANIAAATVASGGTIQEAREVVQQHLDNDPLIYGQSIQIDSFACVGTRVELTISSSYEYRSVFAAVRPVQPILATGAAEAVLVLPSGEHTALNYLSECPLTT